MAKISILMLYVHKYISFKINKCLLKSANPFQGEWISEEECMVMYRQLMHIKYQ